MAKVHNGVEDIDQILFYPDLVPQLAQDLPVEPVDETNLSDAVGFLLVIVPEFLVCGLYYLLEVPGGHAFGVDVDLNRGMQGLEPR